MDYLARLGDNVKRLRKQQKMSQEELALKCGYGHRSAISWIEQGKRGVPISKLPIIAQALDCTVDALIGDELEAVMRSEINAMIDQLTSEQQEAVLQFLRAMILKR